MSRIGVYSAAMILTPVDRRALPDLIAAFSVDHNLAAAQDREVLGKIGLFDPKSRLQGARGKFSIPKGFDDGDARGMR